MSSGSDAHAAGKKGKLTLKGFFLAILGLWVGLSISLIVYAQSNPVTAFLACGVGLLALPTLAILIWLVGLFPAVLIHETGHWICGRLAGLRLYEFAVWPFRWQLLPEPEIRFEYHSKVPGVGGWVYMFPEPEGTTGKRYLLFILGGLGANAIYAALLIWLGATYNQALYAPAYIAGTLLVSSLIPYKSKAGLPTDGLYVFNLLLNPSVVLDALGIYKLRYLSTRNPSSITRADIEKALAYRGDEGLELWMLGYALLSTAERERRRELVDRSEALLKKVGSRPELLSFSTILHILIADCVLLEFFDPERAGEHLPTEKELTTDSLKPYLLVLACLQRAADDPDADGTWRRLEPLVWTQDENLDKQATDRHRLWFECCGPLVLHCPELLKQAHEVMRPRQWDEEGLRIAIACAPTPSSQAYARMLSYYHALDSGETSKARDFADEAYSLCLSHPEIIDQLKHQIGIEAAFAAAVLELDVAKAESRLPPKQEAGWLTVARLKAEAAIDVLRGRGELANVKLAEAEREIKKLPEWEIRNADDLDGIQRVRSLRAP